MKAKEFIPATKPRNFVAKNQKTSGAGAHKDLKKAQKQGYEKHKKPAEVSETALRDKDDLQAKRKALQDIQMDPNTHKDPDLKAELARRKASLEKQAKAKGVTEGSLNEYRDRMYQYLKSIVPGFPDYVVKDWLYANFARGATQGPGWSFDTIGKDIPNILKDMGLSVDTKWQLVPNMKFTMDMWEPKTLKRLQARAGGSSKTTDPDVHIPARDAERHATQASLAQQQGGVRKEPVILIKTTQGYELLEGWHRTIQHFAMYPQGYTGPAYVAVAQGQQGVAEDKSRAMDQTAQRLTDPTDGKTAKLRAAGDRRREEQLKSRDIAKKNNESQEQGMAEGPLELETPNPVVVIQDLKGNILDKINLSVAVQKYKLGNPQNIKNQLAHQNYTTIGNYIVVSPMSGQPQDNTTQGVAVK